MLFSNLLFLIALASGNIASFFIFFCWIVVKLEFMEEGKIGVVIIE
jgi:hypothetical protein